MVEAKWDLGGRRPAVTCPEPAVFRFRHFRVRLLLVRLSVGHFWSLFTASDCLHNCPFPVPSGKDMSVPEPLPPDGVLAAPADRLVAREPTPGMCYGVE